MVLDREVLQRRLRRLEEYVGYLKELKKIERQEYLANHVIQSAVERDLQLAIECVLDIGNHIIAAMGLREPERYQDIILILGEEGILPQEFAASFALAAGFRNILVHDYMEIDRMKVYEMLQEKLDDFGCFAGYVMEYMTRE